MTQKTRILRTMVLTLGMAAFLGACAGTVEKADPNPTPGDMKQGEGLFSGKSGNLLDAFRSRRGGVDGSGTVVSGLAVNPYLWRASLEALSFMPLKEVDSTGGVITTDWYVRPDMPDERFQVNVLILGQVLRPQTLKVNVFRQKNRDGAWQDSRPDAQTARGLEDIILTDARTLRVKDKVAQ